MSNEPLDHISRSHVSDCCGAPIMPVDICSYCREHCQPEPVDDEPDPTPPKPLTPLENWQQNDEHNVR